MISHLRLLGLFAVLSLAACGSEPVIEDEDVPLPGDTVLAEGEDAVAAEVNGTLIRHSDVLREAVAQGVIAQGATLATNDPSYRRVLDELVDQRLLALEARRRGLRDTPQARRRIAMAEERILGNVLLETVISDSITDETVQRVFEEQSELAQPATEVRARHILVASREEADELKRLVDEGADFAELAVRYSLDTATRLEGGDLGYFTRRGVLPAFADVAFSTQAGTVSDPFQTESGWHLLKVENLRTASGRTLEEMRPGIVRFLTFQEIENLITRLEEEAEIRRREPVEPGVLRADGDEDEASDGE
jgi:peptidyl-prolyl cis-trans isomerase C